jgi:hypothetical protein
MRLTSLRQISAAASLCFVWSLVGTGCDGQQQVPPLPTDETPAPSDAASPRQSAAELQRAARIRDTITFLRAECQRNAGGEWDEWVRKLAGVRAELKSKIAALKPLHPKAEGYFEARSAVLEGRNKFPLLEIAPEYYLKYLVSPESTDQFRKERPIVAAARWLRSRGIDVIFVPVPKMTEVYPEYFVDSCPQDRIVAPHIRRLILELLEADVEVVDLLPLFLKERDKDPEPLYLPADPHWGPRGQALAARAIADRLRRYDFIQTAQAGTAIWKAVNTPYLPVEACAAFTALSSEQQQRALAVHPRFHLSVSDMKGAPLLSPDSPVMFIGDSYIAGLFDQVGRKINLPPHVEHHGGETTHAFKDFLREPSLLKNCKVVVWVNCNTSLQAAWPLPPVIKANLEARDSN